MSQPGFVFKDEMPLPDQEAYEQAAERVRAQMEADYPSYGWSTLRPLYRLWFMMNAHRLYCPQCATLLPDQECEYGAMYRQHMTSALGILAKRPTLSA